MSIAPIRTLKRANKGAVITYYDGSTVLGTERVRKDQDVLHPSITMPTKSGYTFVGWSTNTSVTNWKTTLVSTGEDMNLYALYVPNSNTVVSASLDGTNYNRTVFNTDYVSGSTLADAERWYSVGSLEATAAFSLNKRFYASASVSIRGERASSDGWAKTYYDWVEFDYSTGGAIGNGTHYLKGEGYNDDNGGSPGWTYAVVLVGHTRLLA